MEIWGEQTALRHLVMFCPVNAAAVSVKTFVEQNTLAFCHNTVGFGTAFGFLGSYLLSLQMPEFFASNAAAFDSSKNADLLFLLAF